MGKYTNNIIFASWFHGSKKLVNKTGEGIRKIAHKKKETYDVVIGTDPLHPICTVVVHDTVFNIEFLDKLKRHYLRYRFREQDNGRLFLRGADYFEFEGETDKVIKQTLHNFSLEGQLIIAEYNYKTKIRTIDKAAKLIDVSMLWEDYPEFGCYDGLIKLDRLPVDLGSC